MLPHFPLTPLTHPPDITSSITYAPGAPLTTLDPVPAYADTNDTALVPIPAVPQLPPAARTVQLLVAFDTLSDGTNHALVNGVTYNPPVVPAIFSALSLADNATAASAYGPNSFVLDQGDVVDIVLQNSDVGASLSLFRWLVAADLRAHR